MFYGLSPRQRRHAPDQKTQPYILSIRRRCPSPGGRVESQPCDGRRFNLHSPDRQTAHRSDDSGSQQQPSCIKHPPVINLFFPPARSRKPTRASDYLRREGRCHADHITNSSRQRSAANRPISLHLVLQRQFESYSGSCGMKRATRRSRVESRAGHLAASPLRVNRRRLDIG
ncbi:hypothetical protein BD779DRAFT_206501 [Infundibulicybe gibba]|nr:hypothetical protein BD779DRAFT_206501 [Infundibulicybe gibba]